MMWKRRAIAGLLAGLLLGAAPAFAFEETPAPPPNSEATTLREIQAKPMQLGTPNAPIDSNGERKGGINVFGYNLFPKLNFGLDVLYGEDKQPQAEAKQSSSTIEESGDVGFFGRIKRRF